MFCVIPRAEIRPVSRAEEETDISLTLGKVLFCCFKLRAAPVGAFHHQGPWQERVKCCSGMLSCRLKGLQNL